MYIYAHVPRVAEGYGTIAAHTRRRANVLVVFVVFCVHMHSFAGLKSRTPPPTFSDTTITEIQFKDLRANSVDPDEVAHEAVCKFNYIFISHLLNGWSGLPLIPRYCL